MNYDEAPAWAAGPDHVYRMLARAAIGLIRDDLSGALFLDAGAGTGAASAALRERGAHTISGDLSEAMVRFATAPRFVADVLHLPLRTGSVDGAVATLVLSHVDDPCAAIRELHRVTRPGGPVLVTAFPAGTAHPVKDLADKALDDFGYEPPDWYTAVKGDGEAHARQALGGDAVAVTADIATLGTPILANWRLGMAQAAGFVSRLPSEQRQRLRTRIEAEIAALPSIPPLELLVSITH